MPIRLGAPNRKVKIIPFSPNPAGATFSDMETWHIRLKRARLARGFYILAEFANAVNVQPASAHDWESGKTKTLKVETLLKICNVLKIRQDWLLYGEGEMTEQPQPTEDKAAEIPEKHKVILELLSRITESQTDELIKALAIQKQANERLLQELLELHKPSQAA